MRSTSSIESSRVKLRALINFLLDMKYPTEDYNRYTHFLGNPSDTFGGSFTPKDRFDANEYNGMNSIHLMNDNNMVVFKMNELDNLNADKIGTVQFIWNISRYTDSYGSSWDFIADYRSIYIEYNKERLGWKWQDNISGIEDLEDGAWKPVDLKQYTTGANNTAYMSDETVYYPSSVIKYPRFLAIQDSNTSSPSVKSYLSDNDNISFGADDVYINGNLTSTSSEDIEHIRLDFMETNVNVNDAYRIKVENLDNFNRNSIFSYSNGNHDGNIVYPFSWDSRMTLGDLKWCLHEFAKDMNYFIDHKHSIHVVSLFQLFEWAEQELLALDDEYSVSSNYTKDITAVDLQSKIVENLGLSEALGVFSEDTGLYEKIELNFRYAEIVNSQHSDAFDEAQEEIKKSGYKYKSEVEEFMLENFNIDMDNLVNPCSVYSSKMVYVTVQTGVTGGGSPIYGQKSAQILYRQMTTSINDLNTKHKYYWLLATIGFNIEVDDSCAELTEDILDGLVLVIQAVAVVATIGSGVSASQILADSVKAYLISKLVQTMITSDNIGIKTKASIIIVKAGYDLYSGDVNSFMNDLNIGMSAYSHWKQEQWMAELQKAMQESKAYYEKNKTLLEDEPMQISFGDGSEYEFFYEGIFEPIV